jgi:hypothetical protein
VIRAKPVERIATMLVVNEHLEASLFGIHHIENARPSDSASEFDMMYWLCAVKVASNVALYASYNRLVSEGVSGSG